MELPSDIYDTESVRRIDRRAIEEAGIGGYVLMQRAAAAALEAAGREFPRARRWQIVCGAGNNGGDGYVLARRAGERGIDVSVVALADPGSLSGDAATAYADFAGIGGAVRPWRGTLDAGAGLLVDAILGSGLSRNVEGAFAEAVNAVNDHPAAVLALDVPSGISSDTGKVMGTAVHADHTITFVGLKSGLFLARAADFTGTLSFAGLDIPPECRAPERPQMRRIDPADIRRQLPPRRRSAHKGDFGHLLLVGGGPGMPGAIRLAGEGALRAGAGRVTVATHPANCAVVMAGRPELMCHGVEDGRALLRLLKRVSTVAIGPGLGTDEWAFELLDACVKQAVPAVLDADALNLLAKNPRRRDDWILTPHPGEAGRLLGQSAVAVQGDRLRSLASLRDLYGGTVVLKGAGTLVSAESGSPWLCTAGNPGMASPGMGDVLTGIVAGLLAQGLAGETAAKVGVMAHAAAGDAAAGAAPRGLLASDVLSNLRPWLNP
ncbi:MAG TPA: NAD(P)H-hydrate dehydratase [Woeseiaceae bacterium]|nr:NAD(P)H-hydrate dehydratase [Woeseiaceae bacterium]